MPFRETFDCLWCGRSHTVRSPTDIEGYALLCPDCVGRAGDNGFLRFRLRTALVERSAAGSDGGVPTSAPSAPVASGPAAAAITPAASEPAAAAAPAATAPAAPHATQRGDVAVSPAAAGTAADEMLAYYEARAGEYDDWYLRRGRYSHGPIQDMAWQRDLDEATLWLDALPWTGEIVELAAGTGWWSPLLARKGELSIYDALEAPLDRARERLVAHRLKAHIHVRDAWEAPDRAVDGLFTGFWLSHVARDQLVAFLRIARAWLRPGGLYAFIDSRPDPESGPVDRQPPPEPDVSVRRLADGRAFTIPKIFYTPDEFEGALLEAGFTEAHVTSTARFFLLGRATA